jgi:nucleoside-diphosphate-sugar epimerase
MRVLLIGYGYTARALARALIARGDAVSATARGTEALAGIAADGAAPVLADPAGEDGLRALAEAARGATHLVSSVPPGEDGDPILPVLAAMEDRDRPWQGYLSTTGVYGDRRGGWAFEWEAPTPGQTRSVRRAEAEAGWLAIGARVFRLSGIYGPGRSALDRLRDGTARIIDHPGQVFARVHVDDIAAALIAAMDQPEATGLFNLADDRPCSQREVMEGAAAMLGMAPPAPEPFDPDRMRPMLASFHAECRRVSNARAKAVLGWRPGYPTWREGLAAALAAEKGFAARGGGG